MTASVLLVPITAFIDDYLSSAILVSLFEGFTQATEQSCFRGAQPIAMVYLGSVALYFFGAIFSSRRHHTSRSSDHSKLSEE